MIGCVRGILAVKQPPNLLVDVGGVGYEIQASLTTCYQLPDLGNSVTLHTHLVVREDAHSLYGFYEERERTLFRTLIKVNGVGPKMALAILSSIDADEFAQCVVSQDVSGLVKLPGIGKKTAERLVVEMRDRLADWQPSYSGTSKSPHLINMDSAYQEAQSALIALGYKPQEANRMLGQVNEEGLNSQTLIRRALKSMGEQR